MSGGIYVYLLRRLASAVPTLIGVSILAFVMASMGTVDPAQMLAGPAATRETVESIRRELGLDQPLYVQYGRYVGRLLQGEFGRSYLTNARVIDEIWAVFPYTVELVAVTILLASAVGIPLGVLAAVRRGSLIDRLSMIVSMVGVSVPIFFTGLALIYIFAYKLGWFPISGRGGPLWTVDRLRHIFLPAVSLAGLVAGSIARLTRASMLEVLSMDYVRTARAKGASEWSVVLEHALRNALIPVVTIIGLQIGWLLGGAVVTQTVFAWPGLGRVSVNAILNRDLPILQGAVILSATAYVLVNLVVDILYGVINPRIRLE